MVLFSLVLSGSRSLAAEDLFSIITISNQGRAVASRLADFNGDGRSDLMVVFLSGIPPKEERGVRVYLQRKDGTLSEEPTHIVALPPHSGVYDLADLHPHPGVEMVILRPTGVSILSLADSSGRKWELPTPSGVSFATAEDERGFEPFKLVYPELAFAAPGSDEGNAEPWLLIPQFGRLLALDSSGALRASLETGRRSNYFVIPQGNLVSAESNLQVFIDSPKVSVGDINGDGRIDIASSTRHEIRVFLRREDGSFSSQPDRSIPLGLVTPRDHIRGSGGVSCEFKDFDGDGVLDLLISHVEGSITDATTTIFLYINREGEWNLAAPDSQYKASDALASNLLVDLDNDRQLELLRFQVKFSVFEFIEMLMTREIDADISIHRYDPESIYSNDPWVRRKISIPFSFDTFRPAGFVPTIREDLNGDGYKDLLLSGDGDVVDVYLGGKENPFARRTARQSMPTAGMIQFGDYDSDGLPDFVIFDPHNFDVPIRVVINRGMLPGTPDRSELIAR